MEKSKYKCPDCQDTGIVADKINHTFHTCWKCLEQHKLDSPKEKSN